MEHTSGADPFADESNVGTARYVGTSVEAASAAFAQHCENIAAVAAAGITTIAAAASTSSVVGGVSGGGYLSDTINATHEFQTMKPGAGQKAAQIAAIGGSNVTSFGGRTEIPHSELVKMLYYLEGELQARDVVIAALRNERVKHLITQIRTKRIQPNDPYAAIFRDKIALNGNLISRESSTQAAQAEMEVRQIIEQQMEQQYQMVSKQRATHVRMVNILTESLENNQRMLAELEVEKRKNENDAAHGDNITYGLELERTKLKDELEQERTQVQKLEKELKKMQETLEYERNRQKQIVLLLIAERKKILMKYIEEGKRSEDLAQILAEEKQRSDTIAEGLEEESKKSLRMEEELEKQTMAMDHERKSLIANLSKEELRVKELEQELAVLRSENEALKKQQQLNMSQGAVGAGAAAASTGLNAAKARNFSDESCATTPLVNIAKIVQPTATVSSVPVSGPTTGIARSIAPGQNIRSTTNSSSGIATAVGSATAAVSTGAAIVTTGNCEAVISAAASTVTQIQLPPTPSPAKMQPTATIQRAPGGKYAAALAAAAAATTAHDHHPAVAAVAVAHTHPHPIPIAVPPVTVPPTGARGAPPPIPTKPIVPPKREPSLSRLGSITAGSAGTNVTANATTAASGAAAAAAAALLANNASTSAAAAASAAVNANMKLN